MRNDKELRAMAKRLWPDSPRNAREWLRAVAVVRATGGGWVLERHPEARP